MTDERRRIHGRESRLNDETLLLLGSEEIHDVDYGIDRVENDETENRSDEESETVSLEEQRRRSKRQTRGGKKSARGDEGLDLRDVGRETTSTPKRG